MDKIQKTIIKLNKNTMSGEIKWRAIQIPPSIISNEEQLIGPAYSTNVDGTTLLIAKYRTKYYIEDAFEGYTWIDRASLYMIDKNLPIYDFGNPSLVLDLYSSIQYQSSNVDEFMNKLLGDEAGDDDPWGGL